MHPPELVSIAAAMARAGLARLELDGPGLRLALERGPRSAPPEREVRTEAAAPVPAEQERPAPQPLRSPGPGTFLRAHPLHEDPLAADGETVAAGQVVALVRVGDVLLPVRTPMACWILGATTAEESLVGYGDPLLAFLPST